jgi:2-oxoglutarate ferredoxin oxidoreductase subunit beta
MSEEKERTRFNTAAKPNWCPGCGNFGIQAAIKKALHELELDPHQVVISSGIGCSGKIPHWINVNGIHGLHGRPVPVAGGIKLGNHNLTVIAEGGDGDAYSEGMSHFIHGVRRNIDHTYLVHDNGTFSLTTGQASPTGEKGFVSAWTPGGAIEPPIDPIILALAAGGSFVARGYSGDLDQLAGLIVEAVRHRGFSFIDIMQVCVTYHPSKNYKWYQERIYKLEDEGHDPTDLSAALAVAGNNDGRLPTGIFYRDDRPAYEDGLPQLSGDPLAEQDISAIDISGLMDSLI